MPIYSVDQAMACIPLVQRSEFLYNHGNMPIGPGQQGHSWTENSIRTNAPQASGVYAIYNTGWIYVGESNDLQRRLLEHFGGDNLCITRAVPTGFVYELCDAAARMRRQAALIAELRPSCNVLQS